MNPFFLSCQLPPNTEGSAELCEAIGACLRTQVRILLVGFAHTYFLFLRICSYLPLSTANAATFPDKRGQLTFPTLFFVYSFDS